MKNILILILIVLTTSCSSKKLLYKMKENSTSVEKLWNEFLKIHTKNKIKKLPESFYFCDNEKDADECADLVVKGIKRATATSLWWYEKNNEPLPEVGVQYVITDWKGNAIAIIETTKVEQVQYKMITADFAEVEGEGDKSLKYWGKVHEAYYKREMEPVGDAFSEEMIIVCEYFKTIFTSNEKLSR